ncbi:uncharacterized protein LOC134727327 [Mytilus trossulus]|uniref:uncharacterized protein LOC134727327 n=1 Tax=Mytilus trossulus TaxID=6551 RepID=UPI00300537FD
MLRRIFHRRIRCLTALLTINVVVVTKLIRSFTDSIDKPKEHQNVDKRSEEPMLKSFVTNRSIPYLRRGITRGLPIFNKNNENKVGAGVRLSYDNTEEIGVKQAGSIDSNRYDPAKPINFIPLVPKFSVSDIVYRLSDTLRHENLKLDNTIYSYKILILTPLHNSEKTLFRVLSTDGTVKKAKIIIEELKASGFRINISFYHFDIGKQVSGDWWNIHQRIQQYKRRQHLAKARNLLLKNALSDQDYVLWIESDIGDLPQDIIQQLLFAKKVIVNPSCLFKQGRTVRNYDKNMWRETPLSLEKQMKMPANYLILEGYGSTSRIYLPDLRGEGRIVPLDGVGGCTLLVRAPCHRKGLDFPETLFDHHIETEGLAKKAKTMGYSVDGMPFVEVFHF